MATSHHDSAPPSTAWAPLRIAQFRALWLASFASNVGTLMHNVGVSWMMTSLSPSPLLVALVQTATNLPTFMLALPAGALADIVDRRRLLLVTQTWMLASAALLGLLTLLGISSPWLLLALTFALGLGAALNAPAWQAIVPELVPRGELATAVALNSAGFNLARAVGPAIGGLIVASVGPGATFMLNAASFLAVLGVLYRWHRPPNASVLPAERVWGAMLAGVRYVRHAPELRAVLIRVAGFIVFGGALWALLPVIARFELGLGPEGYGLLLGCLGIGAVVGAMLLPRLRRALSIDARVAISTLVYAAGAAVPAFTHQFWAIAVALCFAGAAWLVLLSGFNTAVQSVVAEWVRGRAIAVYLLIVFGGLALGSAVWGAVAERYTLAIALGVPSLGMVVALAGTSWLRLAHGEGLDLTPSDHWPEPQLGREVAPDAGPVFVEVEYLIDPAEAAGFLAAMRDVRRTRLRDGAIRWTLLHDVARPGRYVESFMAESWIQHLRQHARATRGDADIQGRAIAYHRGEGEPVVSHFLAEEPPRTSPTDAGAEHQA